MMKLNIQSIEEKKWQQLAVSSWLFIVFVPFLLYLTSTLGLLFRADAIDMITSNTTDRFAERNTLLAFLAAYFVLMAINILLNSLFDRFSEQEVQQTVGRWLKKSIPTGYISDLSFESPTIFYQNVFSRLSEIKAAYFRIIYKLVTFIASIGFFSVVVVKEGYYKPLLISPFIFILVVLSEWVLRKEFKSRSQQELIASDLFLDWLKNVFSSWGMISRAWPHKVLETWTNTEVNNKMSPMKRLLNLSTAREAVQSLILNTSTIGLAIFFLIEAYNESISIGMALSWLPLCNYINEGAFNVLDCIKSLTEKRAKEEHLQKYLKALHDRQFLNVHENLDRPSVILKNWSISISLPNIQLSACQNPGVYRVRGSNGSGKSSLLRYLCGFPIESSFRKKIHSNISVSNFKSQFACLLPQELVQVSSFNSLARHVYGPECDIPDVEMFCPWEQKMGEWGLTEELSRRWSIALKSASQSIQDRIVLSGGESRLVQLARILLNRSPNSTILMLDEPELSLDEKNRELVFATLRAIGEKFPIVIVTHTSSDIPSK